MRKLLQRPYFFYFDEKNKKLILTAKQEDGKYYEAIINAQSIDPVKVEKKVDNPEIV